MIFSACLPQGWFNYTLDVKIALILTDSLLDSYEQSVVPYVVAWGHANGGVGEVA